MKALTTILACRANATCLSALACFAASLIIATAAQAQATINDCEKIQAADAYNQCLAKFGPPAKSGNLEPERPGDIKSSSADAAASGGKPSRVRRVAGRHRSRGTYAHRGRGGSRVARGRKRMTFSVGK